jgi:hypothetical protein
VFCIGFFGAVVLQTLRGQNITSMKILELANILFQMPESKMKLPQKSTACFYHPVLAFCIEFYLNITTPTSHHITSHYLILFVFVAITF